MQASAVSATTGAGRSPSVGDPMRGLEIEDFLKLMITELQNQDPLNPMDNHQILQQIGSMREIAATGRLTDTLEAVLLGQTLANATSLIGKQIEGLTDSGDKVSGVVDKVTVADGQPRLHVGNQTIRLKNVRLILPGEPG
jgi:flagellar basal-body rod modification protein FlgD